MMKLQRNYEEADQHLELYHCKAVVVYSDASFAPSVGEEEEDKMMKSHGGFVTMYGAGALFWASTTQALTAMSTAEAELIEMVEANLGA